MRLSFAMMFLLLWSPLFAGEEKGKIKEEKAPPAEKKATAGEIRKWMRALGDSETAPAAAENLFRAGARAARMISGDIKRWSAPKRMEGIKVLAQIEDDSARTAVARRLLFDKDKSIRAFALNAIKESNTAKNYILSKATSESASTRQKAAYAICALGDKKFVDLLIAAGTGGTAVRAKLSGIQELRQETMRARGANGDLQTLPFQLPAGTTTEYSTEAGGILEMITGKSFRYEEQWRKWWKANRKGFSFPSLEYPTGKKK